MLYELRYENDILDPFRGEGYYNMIQSWEIKYPTKEEAQQDMQSYVQSFQFSHWEIEHQDEFTCYMVSDNPALRDLGERVRFRIFYLG